MKEQLITLETAILAKEKGFDEVVKKLYIIDCGKTRLAIANNNGRTNSTYIEREDYKVYSAPTQSVLQKFIRETRGVHIEIHRNASGYYWSMCKSDNGTDLGYSGYTGPNAGGDWDELEDALENALQVQLSYDLPDTTKVIKHWSNHVEFALKVFNTKK